MKTPTNVSENYNYLASENDFKGMRDEINMEREMHQKATEIIPPCLSVGASAIILKLAYIFFLG